MGYTLLTGSTGLVGRHLLKELLGEGVRVAVLARASRFESAADRVDRILRHWEDEAGHAMPRPVVFGADLCKLDTSLDKQSVDWLSQHCDCVLHCAASMTFRADSRGEPFRTNVEGTKQLLQLCKAAGISQFHHVSTAYVCGLREGRVLETELDEGQSLGNVYEESKLQAEKVVRQAPFLDQVTVYRPASVVGDYRTGYVTSFHGFYLPLQLAHAMAQRIPVALMNDRFLALLGLKGDEGKNLVPVDWVAKAIATIHRDQSLWGQTYHLASPRAVAVEQIQQVIQAAIKEYHPSPLHQTNGQVDLSSIEDLFQEHMSIYRSHWRNDPSFDLTNSNRALECLPCPDMDYESLMRIARYPIERNFVAQRYDPRESTFSAASTIERSSRSGDQRVSAPMEHIGIHIAGSGGGDWRIGLRDEQIIAAVPGTVGDCAGDIYMTAQTFEALVKRQLSLCEALQSGRLMWNGEGKAIRRVVEQLVQAA